MSEPLPKPSDYRRLHPLTPVLRGWKVFAAAVAIAFQQMYGDVDLRFLFLLIAVSIPVAVVYGYLSWRATRYGIVGEDLIVETGVLNRRSRRVRLDRLQSVDVVRPLIARALGLAELRLEVAGGASSNAPLAYLGEPAAQQLRAELLARAAGLEIGAEEAPVAPERELLTVPTGRLVESVLRSSLTVFAILLVVGSIVAALLLRRWQPLLILGPAAISIVPAVFASFAGAYEFRVAESPDGLRLRRGLLETRAQTVPPGRVQALRITSPWLWRSAGWFRVQVTVAGYAGEESSSDASTLLPVGSRGDVDALVAIVFPGLDLSAIPLAGVPRRARWLDPLQRRNLGIGMNERFVVVRRGWLTTYVDVVPHEKLQSARLVQGPLQRRLEAATLRLDVTPGPVTVVAAHRDGHEARELLEELIRSSRVARAAAAPERWMRPRATPSVDSGPVAETGQSFGELTDPALAADPYPRLAELRAAAPMHWHEPTGMWLAVAYEQCNAVLRDRRFGRLWSDRQPADRFEPFNLLHRNQMMENEPPDHTRLRSLVASAFNRGHVERLRPWVADLTESLLDHVDPTGFDLVREVAEPLPVAVVAELLGVPEADRHLLRPWSQAIVAMYEYGRTPDAEERAIRASAEFAAYLREMADDRRRTPRADLVSDLVAAEDGGERLTADELVASAILLLNAGHEASVNGFGNGLVALLDHPDQLRRVVVDPSLVVPAVEEMLRYDSPLQLFERTAKEPVEMGGVMIEAGQKVAALLGAANRDPAAFDMPDSMDVGRWPNRHLSFGAGVHHCLGAPLARMELQLSVGALLRRFPGLTAAGEPVRRPTFVLRGYQSVPVAAR